MGAERTRREVTGLALTVAGMAAIALAAGSAWVAWPEDEAARSEVGVSTGGATYQLPPEVLSRELDGMVAMGAGWVRIDLNWAVIERNGPGRYDWAAFDRIVDGASARGLRVLAVPAYTPGWARPPGGDDKHPPADLEQYVRFVSAAVRRYASRGVRHWELWNEPNVGCCFWKPEADPERYAELVRRAAAAVKTVDGGATVIAGALAPSEATGPTDLNPVDFARRFFAADPGPIDAVSVHPYTWPRMPTEVWPDVWEDVAQVAGEHGVTRLWATEFGAPTGGPDRPIPEAEQARMATLAYSIWSSYEFADGPFFWYAYRDAGSDPNERDHFFGVVRHDFTPKPAWTAIRALADE